MPEVRAQDFMAPNQAAAINAMGPAGGVPGAGPPMGGAPMGAPLPVQPDGGNPVASLLAQAFELIIQGQGDPAHAAAVEQFLNALMSLNPQQSQAPVGQEAMPAAPPPMPQGAAPSATPLPPSGQVQPLPLPQR